VHWAAAAACLWGILLLAAGGHFSSPYKAASEPNDEPVLAATEKEKALLFCAGWLAGEKRTKSD